MIINHKLLLSLFAISTQAIIAQNNSYVIEKMNVEGPLITNGIEVSSHQTKTLEQYNFIVLNSSNIGYWGISKPKNIPDSDSSIAQFNLKYIPFENNITNNEMSPSDSLFLKFCNFNRYNPNIGLNNMCVDYKCNNNYCISYNIEGFEEVYVYSKNLEKHILHKYSGTCYSIFNAEFYLEDYLLILRKTFNQTINKLCTYIDIFDLRKNKIIKSQSTDYIIDIKIINSTIYFITQKEESSNNRACYLYKYDKSSSSFTFIQMKNFDENIYRIY